ncbi:toll/interleukin-1 receptor domain-containing protein [Rhodococcus sp. NPDC058514]|uniref:toll/interleukin-1 receptor domain-containing protein n=1 Tax=unclassified Rhodococcus (in: high G+C Gram-positive bacteria) TaxID=192944 RepID=UPI0036648D9E
MDATDDFWEDLLSHIRQQILVPVVGPDMTLVKIGDAEQRLSSLIGQRLAERYHLTQSPGMTTMGEAVAAFLRERGQDEVERLYRVINDIITEVDPVPGDALRNLAAIDDIPLFVSTTPDRLLANAVNDVRFHGRPGTRELSFSPNQSTSEQARNSDPAKRTDTVVLNLFGQTASTPQYAIHEEDRLEWLHALLSDAASLPDWLAYPLKHQPMLFIGCEIPDWLGRFLLRMSSNSRLSLERNQQFFFVGNSTSSALSNFFATYCRRTLVQQLDMEPAAFVAELRARWEQQTVARSRTPLDAAGPSAGIGATSSAADPPTIFISYMREDADAARRLCDAITSLGGDVWLDERRISPGDAWEQEVLTRIRKSVRLFVPVISGNTEAEEEGYVFREWMEAVNRSRSIPRRRFIVPVVIDRDYDGDPSRYRQIPPEFGRLHFGRAPAGDPDAGLLEMLTSEIRAMRRTDAA